MSRPNPRRPSHDFISLGGPRRSRSHRDWYVRRQSQGSIRVRSGGRRRRCRMGDGQLYDSMPRDGLNDAFSDQPSGWHTEDLAQKFQITRGAQDQWAVRSQQRFAAAQTGGKFKDEIVSVEVPGRKGPVSFAADEHNRPDTTLEKLATLKPAFRAEGTITAGDAPRLNSGAG